MVAETVDPMDDLLVVEMVAVTAGWSVALMAEIRVAPTVASKAVHLVDLSAVGMAVHSVASTVETTVALVVTTAVASVAD